MRRLYIINIFALLVLTTVSILLFLRTQEIKHDIISTCSQGNYWSGKNILWLGTSIPAGTLNNNYPQMVGEILNANVVNNSLVSLADGKRKARDYS